MNRAEVLALYNVDPNGIIQSPGKFEGEMLYIPVLWAYAAEGGADFDDGHVYGIILCEPDHEEFPELGDTWAILMEESETGFVNSQEFATIAEWERACALITAEFDRG